jgi:hypothetical protein
MFCAAYVLDAIIGSSDGPSKSATASNLSVHEDARTEIFAHARLLQQFGPQLGRPRVDTLKDSRPEHERTTLPCGGWRVARRVRL